MSTENCPTAQSIKLLFCDLFGSNVEVVVAPSFDANSCYVVAEYITGESAVHGVVIADLASAARLGAALTQIPMGSVDESQKSGQLSPVLRENLMEVFNIGVNVFPECHLHRLSINRVVTGNEAKELLKTHKTGWAQSNFRITIPRYGSGTLQVLTPKT